MAKLAQNKKPNKPGGASPTPNLPVLAEMPSTKCKVCKSPFRREVDALLATGWSQARVLRHFNMFIEEPREQFTPMNMSLHSRNHLNSQDAAVRQIYEERARQAGIDIDLAKGFIITRTAVLDTLIHQGLQSAHSGNTQVEPREIIAAVAMLDKLEAEQRGVAIDEMLNEFRLFAQAVKEVVGEEMYERIYAIFDSKFDGTPGALNPIPSEVIEQLGVVEEDIEDGEVEEK